MRTERLAVLLVVIVAVGVVAYKAHRCCKVSTSVMQTVSPAKLQIILVADLREADEPGDNCAEIIQLVREAGRRGANIWELTPDSDSPILKQYRVLTNPTVLILNRGGKVVSRYEGESGATVKEIRDRLASLAEAQR